MVFTQYCKFGYKITTKIWNTQGFLQENANLFKFYTLKAALIPPFVVQSRDHLATITDIYVPSFLRPVRGSLAPRLLFVLFAV